MRKATRCGSFTARAGGVSCAFFSNLQVNNSEMLREAALAGLGIALLPVWCVAGEITTGQLIRVLPEWQATPTTFDHCIYAVYQRHRHVPPKVRAFVDFLAQ